ncbi:unnamed protein product [Cuscuta europaea]|uniref:Uncharacterized protein n=1 Tax=Cuscuta europaea TaxID=41803 RepID=A0A9P1ECN1_CUSEU|nr:unnamed protein product [Cuscuta europaea]
MKFLLRMSRKKCLLPRRVRINLLRTRAMMRGIGNIFRENIHAVLGDAGSSNQVSSSSSSEGESVDYKIVAKLIAKSGPNHCKEVSTNKIPKCSPVEPVVSVFQAKDHFFSMYKDFVTRCWRSIEDKLKRASRRMSLLFEKMLRVQSR